MPAVQQGLVEGIRERTSDAGAVVDEGMEDRPMQCGIQVASTVGIVHTSVLPDQVQEVDESVALLGREMRGRVDQRRVEPLVRRTLVDEGGVQIEDHPEDRLRGLEWEGHTRRLGHAASTSLPT